MVNQRGIGDRRLDGLLAHRDRLSGQQRLVDGEVMRAGEHRICRNPVAFGQDEEIATDDLAARDPLPLPVPDHERSRTGQLAQGFQHAFGAGLLHDGDDDGDGAERQEQQRLAKVAEQQVDQPAAQKQREHRLAQHLEHDAQRRAPFGPGQFVETVLLQPQPGLGFAEPGRTCVFLLAHVFRRRLQRLPAPTIAVTSRTATKV